MNEIGQIVVAVKPPTLAEKLGLSPHDSPLLKKAAQLGLGAPELPILAAQRGCIHYSTGEEPAGMLVSRQEFTDEELAIALLNTGLVYDPHSIRCGAAMLGAAGNVPQSLAALAIAEKSEIPVRYVAEAGQKYEPDNEFWSQLLAGLPVIQVSVSGVLPHPTRFIAMTGFTRKGPGLVIEWLRPQRRQLAAA
jgi:hypothetical protein